MGHAPRRTARSALSPPRVRSLSESDRHPRLPLRSRSDPAPGQCSPSAYRGCQRHFQLGLAQVKVVVVENLNVSRMLGNRRLARVVAGAGFAEVPRPLSCTTQCKGERHVAGSGSETRNGRRADRKTPLRGAGGATSRKGEETSTPHRFLEQSGHTGTSSQQWADRRDSLVSR